MDEFHKRSPFGPGNANAALPTGRSSAVVRLRRKVRNLHIRHALSWLVRAAAFSGLVAFGPGLVEASWGKALAITAGFLLVHTLYYCISGHWKITRFYKARMYWLKDITVDQDMSPVFLHSGKPDSKRKTA
jgi:cytochrome b subunit of formate dehydrogenase